MVPEILNEGLIFPIGGLTYGYQGTKTTNIALRKAFSYSPMEANMLQLRSYSKPLALPRHQLCRVGNEENILTGEQDLSKS